MNSLYNTIKIQWDNMLNRNIMPLMEFERITESGNEWFVVDISLSEKGIEFSFDQDGLPTAFDGFITGSDNFYCIPFEAVDSERLDDYLYIVSDNIADGYLLSNNIYVSDAE